MKPPASHHTLPDDRSDIFWWAKDSKGNDRWG